VESRDGVRAVEVTRQVTAPVTTLRHLPPLRTNPEKVYIRALTAAVNAVLTYCPQANLAPFATDAKVIVPQTKIPFVVFGPGSIAQAHGPDEYVSLTSLVHTKIALVLFLRGL